MSVARSKRLQIMLTAAELAAVRDWRFARQMPSLASAVRELLRRGLVAEGFMIADVDVKSKEFGLLAKSKRKSRKRK
jgi:hypothetical protein